MASNPKLLSYQELVGSQAGISQGKCSAHHQNVIDPAALPDADINDFFTYESQPKLLSLSDH